MIDFLFLLQSCCFEQGTQNGGLIKEHSWLHEKEKKGRKANRMLVEADSVLLFCFGFLCSDPVESSEESSETEESGDGSGDFLPFQPKVRRTGRDSGQKQIQNEVEGSGAEVAYPTYKARKAATPKLSAEDLRRDNIIEWAESNLKSV